MCKRGSVPARGGLLHGPGVLHGGSRLFQIGIEDHGQVSDEHLAKWQYAEAVAGALEEPVRLQRAQLLRLSGEVGVELDTEALAQVLEGEPEIAHQLFDDRAADQVVLGKGDARRGREIALGEEAVVFEEPLFVLRVSVSDIADGGRSDAEHLRVRDRRVTHEIAVQAAVLEGL